MIKKTLLWFFVLMIFLTRYFLNRTEINTFSRLICVNLLRRNFIIKLLRTNFGFFFSFRNKHEYLYVTQVSVRSFHLYLFFLFSLVEYNFYCVYVWTNIETERPKNESEINQILFMMLQWSSHCYILNLILSTKLINEINISDLMKPSFQFQIRKNKKKLFEKSFVCGQWRFSFLKRRIYSFKDIVVAENSFSDYILCNQSMHLFVHYQPDFKIRLWTLDWDFKNEIMVN